MTTATPTGREDVAADLRKTADPDKIRDRSRTSGFDLLKMTVGLSTASVAVFFSKLLEKFETPLPSAQKWTIVAAILLMAGAVVAGMAAWGADALFYNRWADLLRGKMGATWEAREAAKIWRGYLLVAMALLFVLGVLCAAAFSLQRVA